MQALNDLFEKLLQRDVPARYLLRLGQGESELAAQGDFSRVGRVNAMLARRLTLLAEVRLTHAHSIAVTASARLPAMLVCLSVRAANQQGLFPLVLACTLGM